MSFKKALLVQTVFTLSGMFLVEDTTPSYLSSIFFAGVGMGILSPGVKEQDK